MFTSSALKVFLKTSASTVETNTIYPSTRKNPMKFGSKQKTREKILKNLVETVATQPTEQARDKINSFLQLEHITAETGIADMSKFASKLEEVLDAFYTQKHFYTNAARSIIQRAENQTREAVFILWLLLGRPRKNLDPGNTNRIVENERGFYSYLDIRGRWQNVEAPENLEVLDTLRHKVQLWANAHTRSPSRRKHYTGLSLLANTPPQENGEPPVLLVGDTTLRTHYLYEPDLEIQHVEMVRSTLNNILVILPQNVASDMEEKLSFPLQPVCFSVLQHDSETLQTALKLYSENRNHSFEHYVELATRL